MERKGRGGGRGGGIWKQAWLVGMGGVRKGRGESGWQMRGTLSGSKGFIDNELTQELKLQYHSYATFCCAADDNG